MDQDHLVVSLRELDMFLEDLQLVALILVQTDLADPKHALALEEIRNDREHFSGETQVLGFLRIDAEPGVVGDAVLRGSLGFGIREHREVVVETLCDSNGRSPPRTPAR